MGHFWAVWTRLASRFLIFIQKCRHGPQMLVWQEKKIKCSCQFYVEWRQQVWKFRSFQWQIKVSRISIHPILYISNRKLFKISLSFCCETLCNSCGGSRSKLIRQNDQSENISGPNNPFTANAMKWFVTHKGFPPWRELLRLDPAFYFVLLVLLCPIFHRLDL